MGDIKLKDNLTRLRKEKGLTQKELAEEINYSDKVISKWEREESFPDILALKKLANFFDVSIDSLVGTSTTFNDAPTMSTVKLDVSLVERPSFITRYWILIPFIFLIVSIFYGPEVFFISLFGFSLLLIIYSLLLTKYSFESTYQGHHIKIINRLRKLELYIDDILVDGVYGLFHFNPVLTTPIGNKIIRVRIYTMISIKCDIFVN